MKRVLMVLLVLLATVTIYDNNWNRKGYIDTERGIIYDKDWQKKGYIKDDRIYDKDWKRKGEIKDQGGKCLRDILK